MAIVTTGATLGLAFAAVVFWREDLRYSLPTPRPAALVQVPKGTRLPSEEWLNQAGVRAQGKPALFHFFNPHCPCSRFNLDHLNDLRRRFGDRIHWVAVIQTTLDDADADDRQELDRQLLDLGLDLPRVVDQSGRIANAAGIYATPQAVLVDPNGKLVYRGNYNTSRYCTDPRSEFVRIAIESLVGDGASAAPPDTPAYGCPLPSAETSAPEREREFAGFLF